MVKNGTVIYAAHPTDAIIPGVTLKYVEEDIDLNAPLDGGVLIRTVALSSDPYMRYRMRDPKVPNFSPHLTLGAPYVQCHPEPDHSPAHTWPMQS